MLEENRKFAENKKKNGELSGVNIWICVLDYLNKTQDSRSFGAKPPCQDLMKNTNCKHNIKILEK